LGDLPPVGDIGESIGLASLLFWRNRMLEWKPRLIFLLVLLVTLAALLGQWGWALPQQWGWEIG